MARGLGSPLLLRCSESMAEGGARPHSAAHGTWAALDDSQAAQHCGDGEGKRKLLVIGWESS